ncbi:hypothetical protein MLD38_010936 [Melastoma candidum]|uniref:Uncharacterized protein n=1 Tax=Melastoma candidum TaxID=119954 RepID=A0ACB9R4Y6_9MYRT|nr:hypothetical protein MLD38_010936 [Melastoma candidum]
MHDVEVGARVIDQNFHASTIHFYAGDWDELSGVLSIVRNDSFEVNVGLNFRFSEEESVDGCSSHKGGILGHDFSSRRSRKKLSGSRAWERASEQHLMNLVDEEGVFGVHLLKEMADRDVWDFFLK